MKTCRKIVLLTALIIVSFGSMLLPVVYEVINPYLSIVSLIIMYISLVIILAFILYSIKNQYIKRIRLLILIILSTVWLLISVLGANKFILPLF